MKSAALEYAARNIRINAICPGLIQTAISDQMVAAGQGEALKALEKMIPMARVGRPEDWLHHALKVTTNTMQGAVAALVCCRTPQTPPNRPFL